MRAGRSTTPSSPGTHVPRPEHGLSVRTAGRDDLTDILDVQRRAFGRVARDLGFDPALLPPVRESVRVLIRLHDRGTVFLVAEVDSTVVGAVRAHGLADGSVEIGRLAVDDGWEGRGVGAALMRAIEGEFPDARRFELFTGADMTGPVTLYERLGYRISRTETVAPGFDLVWLEKPGASP